MKKIQIKRLVYTSAYTGEEFIGATEYNGQLSDSNILGSIHEIGKTVWIDNTLWLLRNDIPAFQIKVIPFYQYQKRWYELLLDAVRRA